MEVLFEVLKDLCALTWPERTLSLMGHFAETPIVLSYSIAITKVFVSLAELHQVNLQAGYVAVYTFSVEHFTFWWYLRLVLVTLLPTLFSLL